MKRTGGKSAARRRMPAVLAWLRLARVFQKIDAHSERLFRIYGLNTAQFDVLAHVGSTRGLSQTELANALLVTKGNISQLLAKLEQRGLILREQEGRSYCLSLTAEGRSAYDQVVPDQEGLVGRLLGPLSKPDQLELLRLLRKLDRSIVA